jgi:hypothetical protein
LIFWIRLQGLGIDRASQGIHHGLRSRGGDGNASDDRMEHSGRGLGGETIAVVEHCAVEGPFPSVGSIAPGFLADVDAVELFPLQGLEVAVDEVPLVFPGFKGSAGEFRSAGGSGEGIDDETCAVIAGVDDHVLHGPIEFRRVWDHVLFQPFVGGDEIEQLDDAGGVNAFDAAIAKSLGLPTPKFKGTQCAACVNEGLVVDEPGEGELIFGQFWIGGPDGL